MSNSINRALELIIKDRTRWFVWSPVLFGFGVSLYFSLDWQPEIFWVLLPTLLCAVIAIKLITKRTSLLLPILITTIISMGFSASILRQIVIEAPVLEKKKVTEVFGNVLEVTSGSKKKRLLLGDLDLISVKGPGLDKIRLTVRTGSDHIRPGQRVKFKAVLLPPPPPAYPGAYDFQRDLYFKGIGAVGYAISKPEIISENATVWQKIKTVNAGLRHQVNKIILANAPPDTAGFSIAIMTGDRGSLSKAIVSSMRKSGLAHLLAISGLHMGMIGGIIFFCFRFCMSLHPPFALHYSIKKWAAILAMIGLCGYLAISGMSVSALRAFLMITMVFLAICFDRSALSLRNLALAALVILTFLPESLLSASFQMSFSAVFCLIVAYERFGIRLITAANSGGIVKRSAFYIGGISLTSLIASIATTPFAIYHFGSFAALGILANLVAVPIMGFWVMPWTLISFIVLPFDLSAFTLEMAGHGIIAIQKTANLVAELPASSLQVSSYSPVLFVMISLSVLWFFIWRTGLRWLAVGFILVGGVFQLFHQQPDILFADSGNLFLFKLNKDTYKISSLRSDRFERGRWETLYGVSKFSKISKQTRVTDPVRCDLLGCIWRKDRQLISYSRNWMSQKMDCQRANIILSAAPIKRGCVKPDLVIDRFDLWRGGTHAIYFDGKNQYRVESVNSVRGNRPWVPKVYRQTLQ